MSFLYNSVLKLSFFLASVVIIGCGVTGTTEEKAAGGTFKYCAKNRIDKIHPTLITDGSAEIVAKQVFEGLVKLNPQTLEVEPNLAESITFDPKNFIYTFNLKQNIFFHQDDCFGPDKTKQLTADDVIFSFKNICTKQIINKGYHQTLKGVVKGVENYFNGNSDNIEGIRKTDDFTIEIELHRPNGLFLKKLTGIEFSIVAKEAIQEYGDKNNIGTGPFIPQPFDSYNDVYILLKNENYHKKDAKGNPLPYLDSIIISFETPLKEQINKVVNKELSCVMNLPLKAVKRVIKEHKDKFDKEIMLQNGPFLSTHYIEYNLSDSVLKNKYLRKAISYALDRNEITYNVFGETRGKAGNQGFTHPNIINYRKNGINGYISNLDSAKSNLLKANLSAKDKQITLEISQDDYEGISVAEEIRFQLKNTLGLNIKISIVPELYKSEKARYARGQMYISSVSANFPSPEAFLYIFYSKPVPKSRDFPSYPNTTRFKDKDFDRMMDRARRSIDEENANESFAAAERLLMIKCPVTPLWYGEVNRLINSRIKNFYLNSVQSIDFSKVYFTVSSEK